MWCEILDFFIGWLFDLLDIALEFLPDSPFQRIELPAGVSKILGWFNYFIPVRDMLVIGTTYLGAVAIYYIVRLALRWSKYIS